MKKLLAVIFLVVTVGTASLPARATDFDTTTVISLPLNGAVYHTGGPMSMFVRLISAHLFEILNSTNISHSITREARQYIDTNAVANGTVPETVYPSGGYWSQQVDLDTYQQLFMSGPWGTEFQFTAPSKLWEGWVIQASDSDIHYFRVDP